MFLGLYEEGVFRVPGNAQVVEELKARYNLIFNSKHDKKTKKTSVLNGFHPDPTVHDVAQLLKDYFKELKLPVRSTLSFR